MPPSLVAIPVISKNGSDVDRFDKGKAPLRQSLKPRIYNDEPLPIKPSALAPKNAQLVGRILDDNLGVTYQLKIGDVEINDVELDEVLQYVSALDLEEFENRQFEEERAVLKVVEDEKREAKRSKRERMAERARSKGVVLFEEIDSTNDEEEAEDVPLGKHGRARPSYAHMFKKGWGKGGKDPMLLSGDDDQDEMSGAQALSGPLEAQSKLSLPQQPQRKRRKRDPETGELLPLVTHSQQAAGQQKKRVRRRRHPETRELMPLGWRYDGDIESSAYETAPNDPPSPSFKKLSLAREHGAKRQRLNNDRQTSQSTTPEDANSEPERSLPLSSQRSVNRVTPVKPTVVNLVTSEDESEIDSALRAGARFRSPPKPSGSGFKTNRTFQALATTSALQSSPESEKVTPRRPQADRTSILNPSATRASSTDARQDLSETDGQSDDDLEEGEWYIEAILGHHISSPTKKPKSLGNEPLMMYQVKWEGYDEPTWEPVDSFDNDPTVLREYRRRVGLDLNPGEIEHMPKGVGREGDALKTASRKPPSLDRMKLPVPVASDDHDKEGESEDDIDGMRDEEDEDEEESESDEDEVEDDAFIVEAIVDHHLSDPKTHPPDMGKTPIMLYKVKWKGYEDQPTWEPASSFEDLKLVREYIARKGLDINVDGDTEMAG